MRAATGSYNDSRAEKLLDSLCFITGTFNDQSPPLDDRLMLPSYAELKLSSYLERRTLLPQLT